MRADNKINFIAFFHPALIILKNNNDAAVKIRDNIPIAIRTKGFPLRKTGTASNAALFRISLIIRLTRKIPNVKPKERIKTSVILFAIFMQIKTAAAVIPLGKLIKVSVFSLFLYKNLKIKYSKPSYTMALTGNKSTYIKMPEINEVITLEKNNHKRIIDEKISPNFINAAILRADFDSTAPFIPSPHCKIMFMVNPE
jgi:hypothetical protein